MVIGNFFSGLAHRRIAARFCKAVHHKNQAVPCFLVSSYVSLWWQSALTGMGLTLLCSIFLVKIARGYQRQANPTKVFSTEGSAEAEPNK